MKGNDAGCEAATCYRQYHQQLSCVEEAEDEGADEAGTAEQYHRYDVELLRGYLGINLCHAFLHQDAGAILDDEGPAHNLCAHIEELGEYAFTIVRHAEDAAKGRHEVDLVVFLAVLRHLGKQDDEEDGEDDQTDNQVWIDQYRKVVFLDCLKLAIREIGAPRRIKRVEFGLDEVHRHIHTEQRTHRVERLRQVQSACSRLFGSHRQNVRVARCLQKGESAGKDEVGEEEWIIFAHHLCWIEEECTEGIES